MKGKYGMSINVLSMRDGAVDFSGFGDLLTTDCVTVRILGNRLVINAGIIRTAAGKLEVQLRGGKSDNRDLCALFEHYCGGKPTVFLTSPGNKSEYIQCPDIPITDEFQHKMPVSAG